MSTKTTLFFFFFLNKIKCLRWWVSISHLSKSTSGFKVLFFFQHFQKEISCFRVSLFYLNWDSTNIWISWASSDNFGLDSTPPKYCEEINESTQLEASIWEGQKEGKDWGKKWRLLQFGGRKTIMVFFTSLRPNARRKRERREKKEFPDPHRLPSILLFFLKHFLK